MTLHLIDHIGFFLIALVFPIWDFFEIRRRIDRIRSGQTGLRMKFYRKVVREEWAVAIVVLVVWFALGRGALGIGLVPRGGPVAWAGYGLAALICGLLVFQARSIGRSPEQRVSIQDKLGSASVLLPQTLEERRLFDGVSVTAGVCEEVVYRGFMIAYLMSVLGAPFWVAGVVSSVVFGFAHAYQGPAGIPRTAAVGGMLAVLYGLTGSLWAPIVVHALMDITSGRVAFAAFTGDAPDRTTSELLA